MDQDQNPHRIFGNLINKAIAFVRSQFPGARHLTLMPQHRKVGEVRHGIAEQLVHPGRRDRIVGGDIVPDISTVMLGFRRPDNPHA